ncbi:ferrochelatase : Ferrochelatase OS=Mesorhizobium sp. L2C084A000 GN=hemH PE=3 SV=1: Ferrochelatase [Gemmata massiliana]|uniref:Ferrochelatase n=1 Tax=Gemmata massiliana TaxID=1210884 RepID=A0A6P2CUJ8_9BACT|nr:ferrochelatase [Gemmata massiliana]VTR92649.1 ferrochelatase : Ferrochelatase OS=Mesorhizobium sp. L2C084A000 GN=hemH PE=3 SV=1: Ferrochelatase [Gemmata massiliana]
MTGLVLIQLGTPDRPTYGGLFPYLRQFLSDPRVIEVPRAIWLPLLYLRILPFRSGASAAKYRRIWDAKTGSPLLHYTVRQTELLQSQFPNNPVRFGMIVGNPPLQNTIKEMVDSGVDKLIALPMFPQYSATSFASATDSLFKALTKVRRVPAVRVVPPYFDHPAYLDALEATIRDDLAKLTWEPEHFVISFHGIPESYVKKGDHYPTHVERTKVELVKRMGWKPGQWTQTYQSRFGRSEWLKPYTDDVLTDLAKKGVKRVYVALPGFTADCLETLDEIGNESREIFEHAGGEHLKSGTCLNDHPKWIEGMARILRDEGHGWL